MTRPAASTKSVWQKLFVKGGTVLLINAPPAFETRFVGSPATAITRRGALAETVILFADDATQLDAFLPSAIAALGPSSSMWIAYRKGDKTFHRDIIGRQVTAHGFTGVAMIAIDETLSALRIKRVNT